MRQRTDGCVSKRQEKLNEEVGFIVGSASGIIDYQFCPSSSDGSTRPNSTSSSRACGPAESQQAIANSYRNGTIQWHRLACGLATNEKSDASLYRAVLHRCTASGNSH